MSVMDTPRGGAPVGYLAELNAIEAASVIYLRLWCDGAASRAKVYQDFFAGLGEAHGEHALAAFEELCDLMARFGRRPLMRHSVDCRCLGSDEACFANFVAAAADADSEDATLIATLLVRADVSPMLAAAATEFGLALKRMGLAAPRVYTQAPTAPPSRAALH